MFLGRIQPTCKTYLKWRCKTIARLAYFSQISEEELNILFSEWLRIVWYEIMQIVMGLRDPNYESKCYGRQLWHSRKPSNYASNYAEQSKISISPATHAEAQHRRSEEDRAIGGHRKIQKRRLAKHSEIESLCIFWKLLIIPYKSWQICKKKMPVRPTV